MTTPAFTLKSNTWHITITGHAGFSRTGPDIVCAACSMLTCALVQRISELEAKQSVGSLEISATPGDVKLTFTALTPEPHETVQTIIAGFQLLNRKYPKHVNAVQLAFPDELQCNRTCREAAQAFEKPIGSTSPGIIKGAHPLDLQSGLADLSDKRTINPKDFRPFRLCCPPSEASKQSLQPSKKCAQHFFDT